MKKSHSSTVSQPFLSLGVRMLNLVPTASCVISVPADPAEHSGGPSLSGCARPQINSAGSTQSKLVQPLPTVVLFP